MTMYDARTRLSAQVAENVRRYFPSRMFETIVPRSVRLAEAPSHGLTIHEYAPQASGAEAYRLLTTEVAARLGLSQPPSEPVAADFAAPIPAGSGESLATS
jgi:chromosome partitioning protein